MSSKRSVSALPTPGDLLQNRTSWTLSQTDVLRILRIFKTFGRVLTVSEETDVSEAGEYAHF